MLGFGRLDAPEIAAEDERIAAELERLELAARRGEVAEAIAAGEREQ